MKKKILALGLAVLLSLSLTTVAFAADDAAAAQEFAAGAQEVLHPDKAALGALDKMAVSLLEDVSVYAGKATVTIDENDAALTNLLLEVYDNAGATAVELPAVPAGPKAAPKYRAAANDDPAGSGNAITGGKYSVSELSSLIRKYMFIKIDDPAQAAALIADTCDFSYALVNGSDGTIYIRVNVEDNPQIFNYDVFRALVEQLYQKQNEEMKKDDQGKIDYVMSYEHIAGELALHTIVFAATNSIINVTGTQDEKILNLYKAAAQADLNVDESRFPTAIIRFIGTLIINVLKFNFLKLFSFLA